MMASIAGRKPWFLIATVAICVASGIATVARFLPTELQKGAVGGNSTTERHGAASRSPGYVQYIPQTDPEVLRRLAALEATRTPELPSEKQEEVAPPPVDPASQGDASPEERTKRTLDAMNAELGKEPFDPQRTSAVKEQARQQLATMSDVSVEQVFCGSSLCKVELQDAKGRLREEIVGEVMPTFGQGASAWFTQHESIGAGRTIMFVAQAGRALPGFSN